MNPHCECPIAGFCTRHQIPKGGRAYDHCRGSSDLPDCGLRYWVAWEQGELGASAPADPVLEPDWECLGDESSRHKKYKPLEKLRKGPGTELKRILARKGIKPSRACSCNSQAAKMDEWGVRGCREEENFNMIVSWLIENAKQYLWIKLVPSLGKKIVVRRLITEAIKAAELLETSA